MVSLSCIILTICNFFVFHFSLSVFHSFFILSVILAIVYKSLIISEYMLDAQSDNIKDINLFEHLVNAMVNQNSFFEI
jgi:hypothetical protein